MRSFPMSIKIRVSSIRTVLQGLTSEAGGLRVSETQPPFHKLKSLRCGKRNQTRRIVSASACTGICGAESKRFPLRTSSTFQRRPPGVCLVVPAGLAPNWGLARPPTLTRSCASAGPPSISSYGPIPLAVRLPPWISSPASNAVRPRRRSVAFPVLRLPCRVL